ncbi:MAG TPA: MazG nucleotide pyrophosphohydrolase domain-containing protein [Candidatus Paceibacterota bacterium]|nr:MazG nucleotide pyrophosphohydrolase domain-containing protein [Candidatus Paceibacterota bacterium]
MEHKTFKDIYAIAERNVKENPYVREKEADEIIGIYLDWLRGEVEEVRDETKPRNRIHLADELADILWVYAGLLAVLKDRGYIDSVEEVFMQSHEKYTERMPAFLRSSAELWESIKARQKEDLALRHQKEYGQ